MSQSTSRDFLNFLMLHELNTSIHLPTTTCIPEQCTMRQLFYWHAQRWLNHLNLAKSNGSPRKWALGLRILRVTSDLVTKISHHILPILQIQGFQTPKVFAYLSTNISEPYSSADLYTAMHARISTDLRCPKVVSADQAFRGRDGTSSDIRTPGETEPYM